MAGECADLGGHGIVGAVLRVAEIPATSFTAAAIKFTATGQRCGPAAARRWRARSPADLSGPDFAKLVMADWVPAGIALGISVAGLHDDMVTTSSGPWGTGNAEVPAYTGLITRVRQDARDRLEQSVRGLGADGVVVSAMTLRVRSDPCHAHAAATDHFAEAVTTGSAVTRFAGRDRRPRRQASLSCISTPTQVPVYRQPRLPPEGNGVADAPRAPGCSPPNSRSRARRRRLLPC